MNALSGDQSDAHWEPNTDIYVCDEGIVIKVELSGMRREDLQLTVENNRLKITGQRPDGCRTGKCSFLLMEINYGSFERIIDLPAGYSIGEAKATYQNGFLRIDVPATAPTPKKSTKVTITAVED